MQFRSTFVLLFPLSLITLFTLGCSSKESPTPAAAPRNESVSAENPEASNSSPAPVSSSNPTPAQVGRSREETLSAPADEPAAVAEEPKEKWADQPSLFRSLGNALGRGVQNAIDKKEESTSEENSSAP